VCVRACVRVCELSTCAVRAVYSLCMSDFTTTHIDLRSKLFCS